MLRLPTLHPEMPKLGESWEAPNMFWRSPTGKVGRLRQGSQLPRPGDRFGQKLGGKSGAVGSCNRELWREK